LFVSKKIITTTNNQINQQPKSTNHLYKQSIKFIQGINTMLQPKPSVWFVPTNQTKQKESPFAGEVIRLDCQQVFLFIDVWLFEDMCLL